MEMEMVMEKINKREMTQRWAGGGGDFVAQKERGGAAVTKKVKLSHNKDATATPAARGMQKALGRQLKILA